MKNFVELSKEEQIRINGGSYFAEGLGFIYGSLEALCITVKDFILTPGASDETLMNTI